MSTAVCRCGAFLEGVPSLSAFFFSFGRVGFGCYGMFVGGGYVNIMLSCY